MAISFSLTSASSSFGLRELTQARNAQSKHFERISSGLRILNGADDSAGLAISEEMETQLRSLSQSARNANDGISVTQLADGALGEVSEMLGRLRELSVQAANGVLNDTQRGVIDREFQLIKEEVDRVVSTTEFNEKSILDGSQAGGISVQVGIDGDAQSRIDFEVDAADTASLGIDSSGVSSLGDAQASLASIDEAIQGLASRRVKVGATQNRLQAALDNLSSSQISLAESRSRIRDVDIASEISALSASNIRSSISVAMQAQANVASKVGLGLLT